MCVHELTLQLPASVSVPAGPWAWPRTDSASLFCPDASSRVSEPPHSIFPDMLSDSASKDVPGRVLLDMDNDTESTAL